ncbi:hypothetical protein CLAFUR4_14254 [Fulvia fulva]|nr:hypothetical protein CLAFUR4_14254 [Fulvia fulva]WPV37874.1 hypothetical protein CLAFUW7_14262 [Fulvia fulva]
MCSSSPAATASAAPDSKAALDTIPQEIFDEVIHHLGFDWVYGYHKYKKLLAQLRLVSKAVNVKISKKFADNFFSTIEVLLSDRESLENALAVARHPVFGAAVRKVILHIDELSDEHIAGYSVGEQGSFSDEHVAATTSMLLAQKLLHDSHDGLKALILTFCHLRLHGNVELVAVVDRTRGGHAWKNTAPQYSAFESKYGTSLLRLKPPRPDNVRQVTMLMQALSLSAVAPKRVYLNNRAWTLPAHVFSTNVDLLTTCREIMAPIEELQLSVWVKSGSESLESAKSFFEMLASGPNLKSLALVIRTNKRYLGGERAIEREFRKLEADRTGVSALILQCTMPKLQELTLQGSDISYADLKTFVARHDGLQKLSLHYNKLLGVDSDPGLQGSLLTMSAWEDNSFIVGKRDTSSNYFARNWVSRWSTGKTETTCSKPDLGGGGVANMAVRALTMVRAAMLQKPRTTAESQKLLCWP